MWWKILGVLILLYALIGGLSTPLNPGIVEAQPSTLVAGKRTAVTIKGYNTHFFGKRNQVWIKQDSNHFVKALDVASQDQNNIKAIFDLPIYMQNKSHTLIVYNEEDGAALLPDGIFVSKSEKPDSNIVAQFDSSIDIKLLKPDGIRFPYRSILNETIRNTFFHVALWMAMFVLYVIGLVYAIKYLITKDLKFDSKSAAFNKSGILYGMLGIITGSLWAKYTWGDWWTNDVKLNMSTIAMFIYFGYLILRSSFTDEDKRARISAVFSIFAFVTLIPLVFVIPRMTDSLHPGNGGNPALGGEDLDNTLRLFFYPVIIAYILLGTWMAQLKYRYDQLSKRINEMSE
jgi:heme exporter protein C